MPDFLRDPIWLGVVVGFLAFIVPSTVAIIVYLKQRLRKELSYVVISNNPVISIHEEVERKVQISYENRVVQNVNLVVIKVFNSGNVPILPDDFHQKIRFSFGKNSDILTADVTEQNPDGLEAKLMVLDTKVEIPREGSPVATKLNRNSAQLSPVLLNSGWGLTANFLVSELDEIKVNGLIVGVNEIKGYTASPDIPLWRNTKWLVAVLLLYMLLLAFGSSLFFFRTH